jgi:hypothetical protein
MITSFHGDDPSGTPSARGTIDMVEIAPGWLLEIPSLSLNVTFPAPLVGKAASYM